MTLQELFNKYKLTPAEKEEVVAYLLFLRMRDALRIAAIQYLLLTEWEP